MSFLSTSENVGYSGLPQAISEASCATQYKMAVEGIPAVCGDLNSYISENSGDEQTYLNDNYFHSKFKIDPNELYTFHDSDVIASEITVSNTEDTFIFTDNAEDIKNNLILDNIKEETVEVDTPNGILESIKQEKILNGHCNVPSYKHSKTLKDVKTSTTKVSKSSKIQSIKEPNISIPSNAERQPSVSNSKPVLANSTLNSSKPSINSNSSKPLQNSAERQTFLDVFLKEQIDIKKEPNLPPPAIIPTPSTSAKKIPTVPKAASKVPPSKSTPSKATPSKSRKGRGPTVHEALERIPSRVIVMQNKEWHAPGTELFQCGPLSSGQIHPYTHIDTSSDDDEQIPDIGERLGCVEESAAESRGARLSLRRAALRRQLLRAQRDAAHVKDLRPQHALALALKKQLQKQPSTSRLSAYTVNQLLAMRGMTQLLTTQERRKLRSSGWSGGTSCLSTVQCTVEECSIQALPGTSYCSGHVARDTAQRLFAGCSAVFAAGSRCRQPILPVGAGAPLCAEHKWKRDNYDKLSREVRPKKATAVRKRTWPPPPRVRRKRRPAITTANTVTEVTPCSNSSTYDSSEDTGIGGLSESEFIAAAANELEVEQVQADDILDSAVLGQIPDEAFTEFFNQAEGGGTFAEGSELARALEAVLDEKALDSLDTLAVHAHTPNKVHISAVGVEMHPGVSS